MTATSDYLNRAPATLDEEQARRLVAALQHLQRKAVPRGDGSLFGAAIHLHFYPDGTGAVEIGARKFGSARDPIADGIAAAFAWLDRDPVADGWLTLGLSADGTRITEAA